MKADSVQMLAEIEARRDELTDLAASLVRMETVNPPGEGYREICDFIGGRLSGRAFEIEYVRADGALGDSDRHPRWNVMARREGDAAGPCVHFNSHIDVVEAGGGWTVPPFGAEVRDGNLYGRGACDMKGGLAASIVAAEAFVDTHPGFAGAVEISGTADEESGGFGGVAYLAEQGYFRPSRVDHVIIPEPLNKDRICLGHRGVWWAEIEVFGRMAHGSMPFLGTSAIRHMGAVLREFEERLIPALAGVTTAMPVVPEAARQATININSIHGGQAEPEAEYTGLPTALVADSCRLVIDRRFVIEEDLEAVKAQVGGILEELVASREGFGYRISDLFEVIPTMTEPHAPVVRAVAGAVREILGREPEFVVSPGTYDQKHIDRIGKLHDCIAYGPGILDLAHQPDEYVGIDDMVDAAKVMALALAELLPSEG
jgi:succinyl-diaminopimelate desuccinylase